MNGREHGNDPRTIALRIITASNGLGSANLDFETTRDAISHSTVASALARWQQMIRLYLERPILIPADRLHRFYFIAPSKTFGGILTRVLHSIRLQDQEAIQICFHPQESKSQRDLWQSIFNAAEHVITTCNLQEKIIPVVVFGYGAFAANLMSGSKAAITDWPSFGNEWLDQRLLMRANGDPAAFARLEEQQKLLGDRNCRLVIITHMDMDQAGIAARTAINAWQFDGNRAPYTIDIQSK